MRIRLATVPMLNLCQLRLAEGKAGVKTHASLKGVHVHLVAQDVSSTEWVYIQDPLFLFAANDVSLPALGECWKEKETLETCDLLLLLFLFFFLFPDIHIAWQAIAFKKSYK